MQGPQPYINRYTNSVLQRAYVDFQDARSALMAFNCFYDEDFSAAAHKVRRMLPHFTLASCNSCLGYSADIYVCLCNMRRYPGSRKRSFVILT